MVAWMPGAEGGGGGGRWQSDSNPINSLRHVLIVTAVGYSWLSAHVLPGHLIRWVLPPFSTRSLAWPPLAVRGQRTLLYFGQPSYLTFTMQKVTQHIGRRLCAEQGRTWGGGGGPWRGSGRILAFVRYIGGWPLSWSLKFLVLLFV